MLRDLARAALVVLVLASTGCASLGTPPAADPSPEGTVACPIQEGIELPPGCIGYDPQAQMDSNHAYRQRIEVTAEDAAAVEDLRAAMERALTTLVGTSLTRDSVARAMAAEGVDPDAYSYAPVGDDAGPESVTVVLPQGPVCLTGVVDAAQAQVTAKGVIADGGCFPAQ